MKKITKDIKNRFDEPFGGKFEMRKDRSKIFQLRINQEVVIRRQMTSLLLMNVHN